MPTTPPVNDPISIGFRLRIVDPRALVEHAAAMRGAASGAPRQLGWADLFDAWGHLARADRPAAEALLGRARGHLDAAADATGLVMCDGIGADLWLRDAQLQRVIDFSEAALRLPDDVVTLPVRYSLLVRLSTALERTGRQDDALRCHYQTLAAARQLGDRALLAYSLGALGGFQTSLLNITDALPLCNEAWALCEPTDWHGVVHMVGANRMLALWMSGQHDQMRGMVDPLIAREPLFPANAAAKRWLNYGIAFAETRQHEHAQQCLDRARDHALPVFSDDQATLQWLQARIFNQTGRASAALDSLRGLLDGAHAPAQVMPWPVDRAHVYGEAAKAYESIGDFAAALRYERRAAQAREEALQSAGHARRLTLQIDYELDGARRQRDDAVREQQRASAEQHRLAELNQRLEAANAAKTRFLAAASHDLRQPVQALAMYMAALQREHARAARAELMTRMNASLQALGSMFDVLLDVSRLDAGLVPVDAAPLRLDVLLRRLVDEHALAARHRGLQLRLHLPRTAVGASTVSDAVLLDGVLRNLLDNALKYTGRGGVIVRLRARTDATTWRVEVRDTGPGIAPDLHALVFQEFFQIGNDERDRSKGLGLGLSIVQRTAAMLGHPLGLQSRVGRGCSFHIEVPRHIDDPAAAPLAESDAAPNWTLAVIDDDAAVRDSLVALLQRWGHRVLHGADSDEVVQQWSALGRPRIDAAIVDLRLRGKRTGLDAITDLRHHLGAPLHALVITGDVAPNRLRLLTDAGQAWLPKPLMPMRLRSWLQGLARAATHAA